MRHPAFAFVSLSALALAGCAVGPDYVAPTPQSSAATGPFLSLDPAAVRPTELPTGWWHLYNDPVLDGLVSDALAANTDVRQAKARIARARAVLRGAGAERLPQSSLSAGGSYARTPDSQLMPGADRESANFDLGLDVSYEVDAFGRISRGIEASRADLEVAQAEADAVRVVVVADTTRAYADAASAAARIAVAKSIVGLLDETLHLTNRRHDAGLEDGLAVARIETLREQRAAEIPALEAERRAALFALATLTGRAPADLPPIAGSRALILEIAAPLPVGDGASLLARRPDVRAAERRLAADTARIGVATADLYPRITLGGNAGSSATSLGDLLTGGSLSYLVGSLIDWVFPNQEATRARIEAANADAEQSLAAFDGAVLQALKETEVALTRYARSLDRRRTLQDAQAAAERAAAILRAQRREGTVDSLQVLDAERTLAETRAQLAEQDAQVSRYQIGVFRALGGGWAADNGRPRT
ncbi:efflux transporter outer membrane subunit [Croceibacterium aestuarii]|uniref:efflux transporter outer membrane subunit n=1 Tax=Croceibacterium aestuarii TaxID=3064139 RepID=UPI00272E98AE|nr:TolC family protein [Croceibacterium sp. D39]